MPFDGTKADEQLSADLGVRQSLTGEARNLVLLRRELVACLVPSLAHLLARGKKLTARPLGEPFGTHRVERVIGVTQLFASVDATVLPTQPLAVVQMSAGELHADAGAGEALDGLPVQALGDLAFARQGPRAGLDPQRPVGAGGAGSFGQPAQGVRRDFTAVALG